jgi:hypothetical protein
VERSRTAWVAMSLVVASSVLAVLAAAVGGPWTISNRSGLWGPTQPGVAPVTPRYEMTGYPSRPPLGPPSQLPAWLVTLLWALTVVTLVVLAAVVSWRLIAGRLRGAHELNPAEPGIPGEVYPDRPVVRQGLATALEVLLATADPTDAVLAAWIHLEAAAERSGVPRKPSDTPTEFTARVLTGTPADGAAVGTLLNLYLRARFSRTGLNARDFTRARDCLSRLSASWSDFDAPVRMPEPT